MWQFHFKFLNLYYVWFLGDENRVSEYDVTYGSCKVFNEQKNKHSGRVRKTRRLQKVSLTGRIVKLFLKNHWVPLYLQTEYACFMHVLKKNISKPYFLWNIMWKVLKNNAYSHWPQLSENVWWQLCHCIFFSHICIVDHSPWLSLKNKYSVFLLIFFYLIINVAKFMIWAQSG